MATDYHRTRKQEEKQLLNTYLCRIHSMARAGHRTGKDELLSTINSYAQLVRQHGLSANQVEMALDALTFPGHQLDNATIKTISGVLLPRERVQATAVMQVISCLGRVKAIVQTALLKWLVMVFPILESFRQLQQNYGVLFHFLAYVTSRKYLCHLIYLVTKREHISAFRIKTLLDLYTHSVEDQSLMELVRLYKQYYPEIPVKLPQGSSKPLKHPDPEWFATLEELQIRLGTRDFDSGFQDESIFSRTLGKRKRTDVLPDAITYGANAGMITIEDIRGVDDFVKSVECIELPGQMASALNDPRLELILLYKSDKAMQERLDYWVRFALHGITLRVEGGSEKDDPLLSKLLQFTQSIDLSMKSMTEFWVYNIERWDGRRSRKQVLELLSFLSPQKFELVFGKIKDLFDVRDAEFWSDVLLHCLSPLIERWAVKYRSAFLNLANELEEVKETELDIGDIFDRLVKQVYAMTTDAINRFPENLSLMRASLLFFENVARYCLQYDYRTVSLPPPVLVYVSFFSCVPSLVSQLCGLLASYKHIFDLHENYSTEEKDLFNSYVMDICNCLWRNRAFNTVDKGARGFGVPQRLVEAFRQQFQQTRIDISTSLSLTCGPAFGRYATKCLRELEDGDYSVRIRHLGPPTPLSFQTLSPEDGGLNMSFLEYRVALLEYLKSLGYTGLHEFLYCTMTSLMESVNVVKGL